MPIKRTAVRSSTRQRIVSGTPLATYFDTSQAPSAPPTSEPWQDRLARQAAEKSADREYDYQKWLMQQDNSLQQKRDADALDRLKAGDYSYFIDYSERAAQEGTRTSDARDYWRNLHDRALTAAQDATISGLIASGDMDLKELQSILLERRDKAKLGDPSFLSLNKQIAQVNQAIQAEAFNKVVNKAYAEYVETGNAEPYMQTLLQLLPVARDDKARQDIFTQIKALRTETEQDRVLKDRREVASKFIEFERDPSKEGELLALLADKAKNGKTEQEINAYIQATKDVISRARQLQADAARGAGTSGGGGTAFKKALDNFMQPARNNYDDQLDKVQKIIRDGGVPTADEWAIFWASGDRIREGAQKAIDAGAAGTNLDTVLKEIRTVAENRDTQKKAAGNVVITQANDILTSLASSTRGVKDIADIVRATEPRRDAMRKLLDSPYPTTEQRRTLEEKIVEAERPVRDRYDAAIAALRDPTLTKSYQSARGEFDKYLQAYEQIHGNLTGAADFDRWRQVIGNDSTTVEGKGQELGVFNKGAEAGFFQSADAGKWGSASYNADNITKSTAIRRNAAEEYDTLASDAKSAGALVRPGWIVEEMVEGRPTEAGRAIRQAGLYQRNQPAPGAPNIKMLPATGTDNQWALPDINEMKASNAMAARAAQTEPEIFAEDHIMRALYNPSGPTLDPGYTSAPGSSAGPGVFNPEAQYDPYGPAFDAGFEESPQPAPAAPNGMATDEGQLTSGGFGQPFLPPASSYVTGTPGSGYNPNGPSIDEGYTTLTPAPNWLDAFNFLDAGPAPTEFPTFTLPDLVRRSAFDFSTPMFNLSPIPSYDFPDTSSGPFLTAGDVGGKSYVEKDYTPPEPSFGSRMY